MAHACLHPAAVGATRGEEAGAPEKGCELASKLALEQQPWGSHRASAIFVLCPASSIIKTSATSGANCATYVTTSSLSPALPFGRTVLEIRYEIDIMKVMTLPV